jgi:hypothetical protein
MQNDDIDAAIPSTVEGDAAVAPKATRKRASKDAPEETSERGVLTEVGPGVSFYVRG